MKFALQISFSMALGLASVNAKDDTKQAIEKALPYLEAEGAWWIEDKKCVSCHHTTFFVWAKDLALEAGFAIDSSILAEQRKWIWESLLEERTEAPENPDAKVGPGEKIGEKNVEALAQLLLSASSDAIPADAKEALLEIIKKGQHENGNWPPGGQLPLQQRPKTETQWISNLWIQIAANENQADLKKEIAIPTGKDEQAKSTEWFAMNAILLKNNANSIASLLKRQNEDGGWSWIDGEPSSPTGTGQALLALARTGMAKKHDNAVDRARKYLRKTQKEDGHWETKSTKKRDKSTRISDFWGSAWAIIGLLEVEKD